MIRRVEPWKKDGASSQFERSAFARGPKERTLRVFIDDGASEAQLTSLIDGFDGNPHIDVERVNLQQIKINSDGGATWDTVSKDSHSRRFFPMARHNLETVRSWGVEFDKSDSDFEKRLILCMMLASIVGCDAFVTSSAQTIHIARIWWKESNPLKYVDAMSIIGLHLRLREDFVYRQQGNARCETDGASFYNSMAHEFLPQFWRWQALCPVNTEPFAASAQGLAEAILFRFTRALRARDRIHGYLMRPPTQASIDEALFYFDGFLVAIAGVFDAAARLMSRLYGLSKPSRPSWNSHEWTAGLTQADPDFAPLLTKETWIPDVIDMVFRLRNSIHEETLKLIGILDSRGSITVFHAAIPQHDQLRLASAAERLGGFDAWGIHEIEGGALSIELGQYVERLLPLASSALTKLMEAAKVERLSPSTVEIFAPPEDWADVIPHVRLLAGIESGLISQN